MCAISSIQTGVDSIDPMVHVFQQRKEIVEKLIPKKIFLTIKMQNMSKIN